MQLSPITTESIIFMRLEQKLRALFSLLTALGFTQKKLVQFCNSKLTWNLTTPRLSQLISGKQGKLSIDRLDDLWKAMSDIREVICEEKKEDELLRKIKKTLLETDKSRQERVDNNTIINCLALEAAEIENLVNKVEEIIDFEQQKGFSKIIIDKNLESDYLTKIQSLEQEISEYKSNMEKYKENYDTKIQMNETLSKKISDLENEKKELEGIRKEFQKQLIEQINLNKGLTTKAGELGKKYSNLLKNEKELRGTSEAIKKTNENLSKKLNQQKWIGLLVLGALLFIIGFLIFCIHKERKQRARLNKQIQGLEKFYAASNMDELATVNGFEDLQQENFLKRVKNLQQAFLLPDTSNVSEIKLDTDVKSDNCGEGIEYYPSNKTTNHHYRFACSTLTPDTTTRKLIYIDAKQKGEWEKQANIAFGNLYNTIKANSTFDSNKEYADKRSDVPHLFADILSFNKESTLKINLIYAVYEDTTIQAMYRHPYYDMDYESYNYPDRPWYLDLNSNQLISLDFENISDEWKVYITHPYRDFKSGFLPIRTLIFEHKKEEERFLFLIDFLYQIDY